MRPLLLTPHHGSEMILKDKVNGRLIPFDPAGISDILIELIEHGLPEGAPGPGRALTAEDFAARLQDQICTVAATLGRQSS
jgi:hypothetical protein